MSDKKKQEFDKWLERGRKARRHIKRDEKTCTYVVCPHCSTHEKARLYASGGGPRQVYSFHDDGYADVAPSYFWMCKKCAWWWPCTGDGTPAKRPGRGYAKDTEDKDTP